jgi:hypothetical protein
MEMDKIVHENSSQNGSSKMAPKPIDIFSYLFKSHCCLDQSESKSIIYFWTQFAG